VTSVTIDPAYHDLLTAPNTAVLVTLLADGSPQGSPVWFLFDEGSIKVSTTADRLKHKNLQRDPRIAITVVDPAKPLRYLEVRGTAELTPDTDFGVRDAIARKHGFANGAIFDSPGAQRVTITIVPTRVVLH